jgi:hypothetical protein
MKKHLHIARWLRRTLQGTMAAAIAMVGLVAFSAPAFAHNDAISGVASCASPLGSGYTITWTISNDWNESERGTVTSVTGGLPSLNSSSFTIGIKDPPTSEEYASTPYLTTALTQTLPATATGTITLDTSTTWSDGTVVTDSGTASLAGLNCAAPVQTISGHIYLCNNSNPTTTEESGGTLAASGPSTVAATGNPLPATGVNSGGYTMTATPPSGYYLVACSGTSTPNSGGTSATEPVTVPSGGTGVGIFYVTPITQSIAGHIYLCDAGSQTTTEVSGGLLSATGPTTIASTPNPLAPANVHSGAYTMTATTPSGYTLVACSGTSSPNTSGTSATEPVTVPAGGAGVGIFYVTPITQSIAGHIYLCDAGSQTTTEVSGG